MDFGLQTSYSREPTTEENNYNVNKSSNNNINNTSKNLLTIAGYHGQLTEFSFEINFIY